MVAEPLSGAGQGSGIESGEMARPWTFVVFIRDGNLHLMVFVSGAEEDFTVTVAVGEPVFL
jgi:predicted RNA-binding protein with TRAM domain